jgi:geranylgeranyl reductase family protein
MDYDVLVVGAGPAGASAAYWLGEAGQRVLVLERAGLPRYKACGGGLPTAVLSRFPFDFSPVVERRIGRVRFRYVDGREVVAQLPDQPIAMVMRDRFDLHILNHSRADVRDGVMVVAVTQDGTGAEVLTKSGEIYRARYVVGADGVNSRVARSVGLRQDRAVGITIEVEVPVEDGLLDEYADTVLLLFGMPYPGYQWIFPKAEHLSVGTGAFTATPVRMREALRREMARLGIRLDGLRHRGHALPVYRQNEPLHREHVVLVGDAAGLVDPLLGEGIRHAVDSGKWAAEAILAGDLPAYTRRIHRKIGNDMLWGLRFSHLFYSHPLGGFELGVRNRLVVQEILELLAGRASYRHLAAYAVPYVLRGIGKRLPVASRP